MANLSAIVTVKTVNPKRIECASVNCDREGRLENKVQGKLDLSPRQDGTGPSIWVDAYLCDVCMSRVREGQERKTSVGSTTKACFCLGGQTEICEKCFVNLRWR